MSSVSLSELTTPLTRAQAEALTYAILARLGLSTTTWKPGAVARALITVFAIFMVGATTLLALIAGGGFLETASGDWLTLLARHVYGVERELATFAAGEITLVNTAGGVYTLDPGDLVVQNLDTGKTYRNTTTFTVGALATITVPIAAVEGGSASTSIAGAITGFVTPLIGVTCSNALAVVGTDDEGDAALKTRCSERLGALSPNGPWDAYAYVAKNSKRADGTPIGITRTRLSKDGFGNVVLYVATATGGVTGTPDDTTTDLGAVSDAIQRGAVPLAVTADVESAVPNVIDIDYQLWIYSTTGRSEAEVKTAVQTAIAQYLATRNIGGDVISGAGYVFRDQIRKAACVFPEVFHAIVTTPNGDVSMAFNEVPILGVVTGSVAFVSNQEGV